MFCTWQWRKHAICSITNYETHCSQCYNSGFPHLFWTSHDSQSAKEAVKSGNWGIVPCISICIQANCSWSIFLWMSCFGMTCKLIFKSKNHAIFSLPLSLNLVIKMGGKIFVFPCSRRRGNLITIKGLIFKDSSGGHEGFSCYRSRRRARYLLRTGWRLWFYNLEGVWVYKVPCMNSVNRVSIYSSRWEWKPIYRCIERLGPFCPV